MKPPVVFCPLVATDKLFAITTNATNGFRHFDDPGLVPASFISSYHLFTPPVQRTPLIPVAATPAHSIVVAAAGGGGGAQDSSGLGMASSLAPASWVLLLQTGGAGAAAAGPSSCRLMLAVAEPRCRWAASPRRARVLVAPRCAALDWPGGSGEEEAKIEDERKKKPARGRPVWRRILFASKKTRSIIILNALTVIYGVPAFSCSYSHSLSLPQPLQFVLHAQLLDLKLYSA
jgi:hypothetical protein